LLEGRLPVDDEADIEVLETYKQKGG